MAKVPINISIDAETKRKAQEVLADSGPDLSAVPNSATMAAIETAEKHADMYGPFDSVSTVMKELNQ